MVFYLAFVVCIIGLVMYLSAKPDQTRMSVIGLHMFWVGLLAWLLIYPAYFASSGGANIRLR